MASTNNYIKSVKQLRREVSQLTLEQMKQLTKVYDSAVESLLDKGSKAKSNSLTRKQAVELRKELKIVSAELQKNIDNIVVQGVEKAAEKTIKNQMDLIEKTANKAKMTVSKSYNTLHARVQHNIVNDIIKGNLYKDNKSISSRIWRYGKEFEKDIQYVINQALLEQKSAIELAKDLEKYVKPAAKRGSDWGKAYPGLRSKKVDYNAMRLARTSINHAYQTATIQTSQENPFITGIEWRSANEHGRTCQLCRDRDGVIYNKDEVPLDHPNGLCTMLPVMEKSMDEIADELKAWVNGEENNVLDEYLDRELAVLGILSPIHKG